MGLKIRWRYNGKSLLLICELINDCQKLQDEENRTRISKMEKSHPHHHIYHQQSRFDGINLVVNVILLHGKHIMPDALRIISLLSIKMAMNYILHLLLHMVYNHLKETVANMIEIPLIDMGKILIIIIIIIIIMTTESIQTQMMMAIMIEVISIIRVIIKTMIIHAQATKANHNQNIEKTKPKT